MHELDDGTGTGLDARRARQTPSLVLKERARDIVLSSSQDARQRPGILDMLCPAPAARNGTIGCAASPSSVTRPALQLSIGSR
jgi:hypothetical protein